MSKNEIMTVVSNKLGRVGLTLKKHSPEILVISGVIGLVGAAVGACVATTKAGDILNETKTQLDQIHEVSEKFENDPESYSPEDARKDTALVYFQTGIKFVKLYGPWVALGTLSVASILASNNILRKRNVALGAAYAAVDRTFKDYRSRVVERFGEEVDRELKYNIQKKKIEEVVIDPDTGKEKKVKKTVAVVDPNLGSQYAKFFDEGSRYFERDAESNMFFLRAEQNLANDRLRSRGYLFLNEVYERLDIPVTRAGACVGWIYDPKDDTHGNNYVDFGLYNISREKTRDFVNGIENVILLDFNVDGVILDSIEEHQL